MLEDVRSGNFAVASAWLLTPVQAELADPDEQLDSNEPRLENAIDTVRLASEILGADGPRRYLVLFTTPAETRGLAGFVGNYAVVTADDGAIGAAEFGRRSDLDDDVAANGAACIVDRSEVTVIAANGADVAGAASRMVRRLEDIGTSMCGRAMEHSLSSSRPSTTPTGSTTLRCAWPRTSTSRPSSSHRATMRRTRTNCRPGRPARLHRRRPRLNDRHPDAPLSAPRS